MISRFIDTTRLHAALAALASLTSCLHHGDADSDGAAGGDEPLGEMVSCALDNGSVFSDDCRLERDSGGVIIIHHPNGAFRRLRISPGGRDVTTADGFAPAITHPAQDGALEVQVGNDRYRLHVQPQGDGANGDAPLADSGNSNGESS